MFTAGKSLPHSWKIAAVTRYLVIAEPSDLPTDPERHALREFVRGGGRLLFCGPELKAFFPEAEIAPVFKFGWEESTARIPSFITHDAHTIALEPKARWGKLGADTTQLYMETPKDPPW